MGKDQNNVIDLAERRSEAQDDGENAAASPNSRLRLRLDMEQAKIAITTSLISVVVLVTFANNSLLSFKEPAAANEGGRSVASVASREEQTQAETGLAKRLADSGLRDEDALGRKPSSLDQLALGFLEGKYALRLQQGKLQGLEYSSDEAGGQSPMLVDRVRFLEQNRELLPVSFDRLAKAASDEPRTELYELLRDGAQAPLAMVEFRLDEAGRMLAMKVRVRKVAQN